eukprot:TRINITY_DN67603_c0_g1_i1.p5 TRINITY_DN67603_c0_g1~~TRINITY_DN67603_c0_g1_i1.p5  ORF type:complete len:100 (+),score=10.38 TRINITY_DN67603_c0_g1_i1:88-387(+)
MAQKPLPSPLPLVNQDEQQFVHPHHATVLDSGNDDRRGMYHTSHPSKVWQLPMMGLTWPNNHTQQFSTETPHHWASLKLPKGQTNAPCIPSLGKFGGSQ